MLLNIASDANFRFSPNDPDWGFTKFCELRRLLGHLGDKPSLLGNDEANITAYIRVIRDHTGSLYHTFYNYDSKKVTGFVGLKNLGSTGYLNVILQCFYFTNSFRKTDDKPVSPLEFTKGLGWAPQQLLMQQDVREMARLLLYRFTKEPKLPDIFRGKTNTYTTIDGAQQSRIEDFLDISINIQNIRSLEESLAEYIREIVDEERTENGIRKTTSGVLFETFPDVLYLRLKRYAYDMAQRRLMKVNDFFAYPEEFDASPYLSADTDRSESWVYRLTGVVVHSGGVNGGRINDILASVTAADVPAYIGNGLVEEREMAARLKKEKEEERLYLHTVLASASQFRLHSGFDMTSPGVDNGNTTTLRIRKDTSVNDFTKSVAQKLAVDPGRCTLWICLNRQNGTRRPHEPLLRANITIARACLDANFTGSNPHIWVEVSRVVAGVPAPLPQVTSGGDTILIFIKNFDVMSQTLRGVTSLYVLKDSTIRPHIVTVMGWPEDTRFSVHEEVKPTMILNVDPNSTFERAELGNGDILCVQKLVKPSE
ncbi:hypothetical protein RJZ90_002695 [Blastomyces dermatitidis]